MRINEIDMPWCGLLCMVLLLVTIETFAGKVKYLHSQKLCKAQQKNKLTAENGPKKKKIIFRNSCFACFRVCLLVLFCYAFFLYGGRGRGEVLLNFDKI